MGGIPSLVQNDLGIYAIDLSSAAWTIPSTTSFKAIAASEISSWSVEDSWSSSPTVGIAREEEIEVAISRMAGI